MGEAGELRTPLPPSLWPRPPRSTRLAPQVRAALSEAAQWLRRSRVEEAQEADRRRRADEEATARAAADAAADAERALRDAQRDAASERGDRPRADPSIASARPTAKGRSRPRERRRVERPRAPRRLEADKLRAAESLRELAAQVIKDERLAHAEQVKAAALQDAQRAKNGAGKG